MVRTLKWFALSGYRTKIWLSVLANLALCIRNYGKRFRVIRARIDRPIFWAGVRSGCCKTKRTHDRLLLTPLRDWLRVVWRGCRGLAGARTKPRASNRSNVQCRHTVSLRSTRAYAMWFVVDAVTRYLSLSTLLKCASPEKERMWPFIYDWQCNDVKCVYSVSIFFTTKFNNRNEYILQKRKKLRKPLLSHWNL